MEPRRGKCAVERQMPEVRHRSSTPASALGTELFKGSAPCRRPFWELETARSRPHRRIFWRPIPRFSAFFALFPMRLVRNLKNHQISIEITIKIFRILIKKFQIFSENFRNFRKFQKKSGFSSKISEISEKSGNFQKNKPRRAPSRARAVLVSCIRGEKEQVL